MKLRETETLETIKYLYCFALLTTVFLNLALIKSNPLTIYALGVMPFRYLDAANLFAFPILIYAMRRFRGQAILLPILSILILGRILNARVFGFYFHENNVHFLILILLTLIFYSSHCTKLETRATIFSPRSRGILALLLVAFLSTQMINEAKKSEIYWNEIAKTNSIIGFAGSTILTAPEVRFPVGLNGNMELLSHPELQSILYVPESTSYVENLLKKYYSTNLQRYFAGNSCVLSPSLNIREIWTARSQSEWQRMAAEDKFSYIVEPRDWQMKLEPKLTIRLLDGDPQSRFTIYRP